MTYKDVIILVLYGLGMLLIGAILSKRNKNSADMFAVSKQSPWWLSGLSAFMSAFSSGTFVVWGGIAFKQGAVAISILLCLGVASLLVGKFLAGKWAGMGVKSAGEFIEIRFGKQAVLFYTWAGMLFKIVAMAVALYSFSALLSAMVEVPEGYFFRDDATGKISIGYACVLSGILMLSYAVSGGLWAVLIIDAIQFVVLTVTVLFVVPLCFQYVGGVGEFIAKVPEGFLSPTAGNFTWYFLACWVIVHFFKLGGEWVFIQRFLAVSSPVNAKRSTYLLGILFIVSPLFWMIPPMVYKVVDPSANPEYSYFLMCAAVLPAGMIGLLVAAMFSATASSIDGEVNVYAGALTRELFKRYINPTASPKAELIAGRVFSLLIGAAIITIAVLIPRFGGAESVILTITGLLAVSMVLPPVWGLYFGKIKQNAVWLCTGASLLAAILIKFAVPQKASGFWYTYVQSNIQLTEVLIGIFVPLIVLSILELRGKTSHAGFSLLMQMEKAPEQEADISTAAIFPGKILGYSMLVLSGLMFLLALSSQTHWLVLCLFGLVLLLLTGLIFLGIFRINKKAPPAMEGALVKQKFHSL